MDKCPVVLAALVLCWLPFAVGRHGNGEPTNHLILFDSPPERVPVHLPVPFDIRTNFSGTVNFVESRDFRLVVNVTAPSLGQAYDVSTRFVARPNGGMMLEVKQGEVTDNNFNTTWLLVALAVLALLVAIYTGVRAAQWYKLETDTGDTSSAHKSFASSSHRAVSCRSRNSLQLMGSLHGDGLRLEDVLRGEDELRQMREIPEEEESEALEMEQLKKLKFKDESEDMSFDTEDSDPQERNLTKSRFHLQNKTVHKELLKKPGVKKGAPSPMYRRTQMGKYEGVPTNDTDDTDEDKEKTLHIRSSSDKLHWSSGGDLSNHLTDDLDRSTNSLGEYRRSLEKASNVHKSNTDLKPINSEQTTPESDQLVKADVHPSGQPIVVSITPRDGTKHSRPGNIYVPPKELKAPHAKLSTFGLQSTNQSTTSSNSNPAQSSNQSQSGKTVARVTAPVNQQDVVKQLEDRENDRLLSMSDIPEDPLEDAQSGISGISGSLRSASIYGSSEIFEVPESGNTYYNLDSDIDVPPLESDDNMWSDGGIPSPGMWPMRPTADKGKTNDDIKLIPGAMKSPGPNTGRMVNLKPRPNSSIVLGSDKSKSPQLAQKKKDLSVPPPPSYEEIAHSSTSRTAFEFPPPPDYLQAPCKKSTPSTSEPKRNLTQPKDRTDEASGDYVTIMHGKGDNSNSTQERESQSADNHDRKNGAAKKGGGGGGGKKGFLGPTYMNVTILATLCVVTLVSGAVNVMTRDDEIRVDITLFAPAHFLTNQTRVFFNELKDTQAIGIEDKPVLIYEASNPLPSVEVVNLVPCNKTCPQGCDELRGSCVCLKGYRLDQSGTCVDVNECMEGKARCDKAAGCYNRKGTYDCICGEDFYGNGKVCRDCQLPCPKDHFEEQPCSSDKQKICKACTKSCRHGFYLARTCGSHENAMCRVCRPQCGENEYESKQCTNLHDRECSSKNTLSLPTVSPNVFLEERSRVKSDSAYLEKFNPHFVGFSHKRLERDTDFYMEVIVRYINPTPSFVPLNRSQPFNLSMVAPSILTGPHVQRYCPNPVPDYYNFFYEEILDKRYKLKDGGLIEDCDKNSRVFSKTENSFICAQPGSLAKHFHVREDFFHARTRWVDSKVRCQRQIKECEMCTKKCSQKLRDEAPCRLDPEGEDEGTYPRLMNCLNCCVKRDCYSKCQEHHKMKQCQADQCMKGNLLKFSLISSWDSSQQGKFFCHIKPAEVQRLLEIDYMVLNVRSIKPIPIFKSRMRLYGDEEWKQTGKMKYSDGLLNVEIDSGLDRVPDFIEGETNPPSSSFKVGAYQREGTKFMSTHIGGDSVLLRPSSPLGIPVMPPARQDCTTDTMDSMNIASKMNKPYVPFPDMIAMTNGSLPISVSHKQRLSNVKVTLDRETPLLKRMFSVTYLKVESFRGGVIHNGSHWVVNISAEVARCPGYLRIQVQDPNNATISIYDIDAAVQCPKAFNLTFALLTYDDVTMYKDVMVVITDNTAVHHFRLYHTSQEEEKLRRRKLEKIPEPTHDEALLPYASKQRADPPPRLQPHHAPDGDLATPDLPIELPFLIAIAGVIILLLVLAAIGLCSFPDIPVSPVVRWYHPIFAVIYMVFQLIYSIVISASVFCFILLLVTRPYVKLINQHGQTGGVAAASTQLELLELQRHLEGELARQDAAVDVYQTHCIADVQKIVDDMKQMHQNLLKSTSDIFEKHRLDLLLEEQKVFVRQKLSSELENFRDDYLKASRAILSRIRQDAAKANNSFFESNLWMQGPKHIYGNVVNNRELYGKKSKPFTEWIGLDVDEKALDIDLSFSLPALPRLEQMQAPPSEYTPPKKRDLRQEAADDMIRSIQVHNHWFFPLAHSPLGVVTGYKTHQPSETLSGRSNASTMLYVFLLLIVVCDVVLLAHRMTKAWTTTRLILFGFPEYYRERKEDEEGDDDAFASKESKNRLAPVQSCRDSPWIVSIKMFFIQTISTTFLPKIVGAIAACVVLVCVLRLSNTHLTVKGLQKLGLYHNATKSGLQVSMTNGRIAAHAAHINNMQYPGFQAMTDAHLTSHKAVYGFYRKQMGTLQNLTTEMYCLHMNAIGIPSNCSDFQGQNIKSNDLDWLRMKALTHACRFEPVIPKLFQREVHGWSQTPERQVDILLQSLRRIIFYTSHLILVYLIVIVIKELSFGTVWILLQRSGVLRTRIIVEQDQGSLSQ